MVSAFKISTPPSEWFLQWDSTAYRGIAAHGYDTINPTSNQMANYVFFPLLPVTVGLLSKITSIPIAWMGQIFSQICFFISLILFYKVIRIRLNDDTAARFGILLLAFSPCNIYFSSFYTESLFLMLSLGIWLAVLRQSWWVVGILGLLLSTTRPNGVMVLLPLFLFAYEFYRARNLKPSVLLIILIPIGLLAFMIYLHYHVGSAFAFSENEKSAWRRPGLNLLHPHLYGASFKAVFALILSFYLGYRLTKTKYWPEALYFAAMLIPSIMSGSLTSFLRYSACLFPFYFALAVISQNKPYLKVFLFSAFLSYTALFTALWINGMNMQ